MSATLLLRTDANLLRLHVGSDAEEVAADLGNGHCFSVIPVVTVWSVSAGVEDAFAQAVTKLGGVGQGNGWFTGVAIDIAAGALARSCVRVGSKSDNELVDTPADEPIDVLWQHVQGCPAVEADKASDIRAALEERLGKSEAKRLLTNATATVAKDQSGHKNRILRIGGTAVQLRDARSAS